MGRVREKAHKPRHRMLTRADDATRPKVYAYSTASAPARAARNLPVVLPHDAATSSDDDALSHPAAAPSGGTLTDRRDAQNAENRDTRATSEQTSTRIHIFAQRRRRIGPTRHTPRSLRTGAKAGARRAEWSRRERRHRQPTVRPHTHADQRCTRGAVIHARARAAKSAHRGIAAQRVTILFNHGCAAQRANPNSSGGGSSFLEKNLKQCFARKSRFTTKSGSHH